MKISIIGTGYVGLVTGTCLAESGNDVICMDIDNRKIEMLNSGTVPIYEPGLEELIKRNVAHGRLSFDRNMQAVTVSDVILSPYSGGRTDVVLIAAKEIGKHMNGYKVVINKSTVPVGTADKVRTAVAGKTKFKFDIVSNPEFLKEGAAIEDFMKPDRVVIGSDSARAVEIISDLYTPFVRKGDRILVMDVKSAEMTKYASNAMLATNIIYQRKRSSVPVLAPT
jgi:UDPglucose 6-dehydrogenase